MKILLENTIWRSSSQPNLLRCILFATKVSAGFPSAADDYTEQSLDLNEHFIEHPAATYFVRASGESMTGAGIVHNDLLIVDRSLKP